MTDKQSAPEIQSKDLKVGGRYHIRDVKNKDWSTWKGVSTGFMTVQITKVDMEKERVIGTLDATGAIWDAPFSSCAYREAQYKPPVVRTGQDGSPSRSAIIKQGLQAGLSDQEILDKVFSAYPDQDPVKVRKSLMILKAVSRKKPDVK